MVVSEGHQCQPSLFIALRVVRAGLAERDRRHRWLARRHAGIAGQARHAHHAVVLLVETLERPVVDRPVVGHAVQRLHLEVRRVHARPVCRVDHRAAADAVEVGNLHRRVVVVHRIVGVAPRGGWGRCRSRRSGAPPSRGRWWGSRSTLSSRPARGRGCASSVSARAPGHGGARSAGADDQDVDPLVAAHFASSLRSSRHRGRRSRTASSRDQSPCSSV